MTRRWCWAAVGGALLLAGSATGASAQGTWDAMLSIQPFPSPYYSDWETNPNIGSLTVMNGTGSAKAVRIFFTVTDDMNRVVASGRSEPETVAPGGVVIYDSPYEVAGTTTHDAELERIAARTGRLPEGDYTACAAVADAAGFVLDEACAGFYIAYPDPPLLLGPDDGARLTDAEPLFQWTPAQVPPEYQVSYALRVVEVLPGQLPAEALRRNIPHYELRDGFTTSLRYPIDGLPLEPGSTYAWEVRALDPNGYPAAANEGRSEIWTFQVDDREPVAPTSSATVLSLVNVDPETGSQSNETYGLGDVCTYRDSIPAAITLPVNVHPAFGAGVSQDTATFYRDSGSPAWAILTRGSRLSYLLYGECDAGAGPLSGLQWIALRRTGQLGDLFDGVPLAPAPATELSLRYGLVVLSLYPTSTRVPDAFEAARDFLDYREIDVRPGLNAFGVVDMKEYRLWSLFEALGYTDKYVELQGFIGVDDSWSVGGRVGGTTDPGSMRPRADSGGVEISRERTVLVMTASLPAKKPLVFQNLFETSQVGLELVVKDSMTVRAGAKRGDDGAERDTDLAAAMDVILSATLTLTAPGGAVWKGSAGIDVTQDIPSGDPCWEKGVGECFKYVLKLGVSELQVGGPVYLSGVEFELDINDGFINMLATRDPGVLDWGAVGIATLGVGQLDDVGKIVLGIGRSADKVTAAATPEEITAGSDTTLMGPRLPTRPRADARADLRETDARPSRRNARTDLTRPKDRDAAGAVDQAPRTDKPHLLLPAGTDKGRWKWAARIALGNLSLPELIRLIYQNAND